MEHLDTKRKLTIMVAIMASMLFAALNQTIIGNALPRIVSKLGGMSYFNWVFTIYMLTSSITAILVGKLSDIYGRKPFLLIGIGLFVTGSLLCGTATDIFQLILYRGFQGLGGGMIMSTAFTSVGDLFPPRERGRWQGALSAAFGVASVLGPTLGGYIVDHWEWHWIFWIFLPVGLVAFLLIWWLFPSVSRKENEPIDIAGSVFLALTITPLLLAFSWAGSKYAWSSPTIIGLFGGSILALILFVWVERKAKNPVLPLHLFGNPMFTLSNLVNFTLGVGMFGAIIYTPFFIQGVIGTSATRSSFVTIPLTLSMVVASIIGGQIVSRTGKYKGLALFGILLMAVGMYLMSLLDTDATNGAVVLYMIIIGTGLGIAFPIFTLTVQNAVEHRHLGVATSSSQLFRQMGGTVGVAVMGTILSGHMKDEMSRLTAQHPAQPAPSPVLAQKLSDLNNPQILLNPDRLAQIRNSLPESMAGMFDHILQMLRTTLAHALDSVFFAGAIVLFAALIFTLWLKEIPLRTSNQGGDTPPREKSASHVVQEQASP
ncbi:MFS transporter [Polycladomyces sp. WAk]|uniref:MFS transporter n=1 Tax=Polycladomyces zharkentensis TaxID=2807616 RepID=A0ABS2WHV0_9BACL|nr:MDR family MFS transporter [Polycladomyces sp. WAk]MBN2909051.1 MFS transporter [Polycladomyces sp. WAk]